MIIPLSGYILYYVTGIFVKADTLIFVKADTWFRPNIVNFEQNKNVLLGLLLARSNYFPKS